MKKLICALLAAAMMLSLVACTSTTPTTTGESTGEAAKDYAGMQLLLGSSSAGGTYYVLGAGWCTLMNEQVGVQSTCEVTAGPASNIPEIEVGNIDFGMVTSWLAGEAYTGTGGRQRTAMVPTPSLRACSPLIAATFTSILWKTAPSTASTTWKAKPSP